MLDLNVNCMSWNPRGLNCPKRRDVVCDLVASTSCQIVCLQETKLQAVDAFTAAHLGGHRLKQFAQRPANGTRGGILILWDDTRVHATDIDVGTFTLSAMMAIVGTDISFKLTTVYGPTRSNLKDAFFAELVAAKREGIFRN
jgi:exonuclease III